MVRGKVRSLRVTVGYCHTRELEVYSAAILSKERDDELIHFALGFMARGSRRGGSQIGRSDRTDRRQGEMQNGIS